MQCGETAYHNVANETQNYNLLPYKSLLTLTRGKPATKERTPGFWELSLYREREFVEFCTLFQSVEWLSAFWRGRQKRWEKGISYTGFSRNRLNPDTAVFHDMSVEQGLHGHVKGLLKEHVSVKQFLLSSFEKLFVSLCDHSWVASALSQAERFSLGSLVKAARVDIINPTKDIHTTMNLEKGWHVIGSYWLPCIHSSFLSLCFV